MIPRKQWLWFLIDTPTGLVYYRNATGMIVKINPMAAGMEEIAMKKGPANWNQIKLSFVRNETYHGINRSFTPPLDFVGDEANMIREIIAANAGAETRLSIACFRYNTRPAGIDAPDYELYYKAPIDIANTEINYLEKLTVNLMEGGVAQLLKTWENTVLQIPCDGSIPENKKVNLDGLKVEDTFYYQIPNYSGFNKTESFVPATFINNEGDNYGIVRGNPVLENTFDDPGMLTTNDFILYSNSPITVHLKGQITVDNHNSSRDIKFRLFFRYQTIIGSPANLALLTLVPFTIINKRTTFYFDKIIPLSAYQKLFLVFQMQRVDGGDIDTNELVGGNFSVQFSSQAMPTRAWGIGMGDLWRIIVKQICELSSTAGETFDYDAVSTLLDSKNDYLITSGDALRASGDPNYQRYYSIINNNQLNFGPVIKTSLKDFFLTTETLFKTALGTGHDPVTGRENIFIEKYEDVFNSNNVTFDIGEIATLKESWAKEVMFTDLAIGYPPQTYDQKAGKYETNTTLQMKAPSLLTQKKLESISKYRADSYGIERLRSGLEGTSTTRNDSDSSVFVIRVNEGNFILDFFDAKFISVNPDPASNTNTNTHFALGGQYHQQIDMPITEGEYFIPQKDSGIFVFSEPGFNATETVAFVVNGIVNSVNKPPLSPPDNIKIELILNGAVIQSNLVTVMGVNTPIAISDTFSQLLAFGDVMYVRMSTTATAEAQINTASITIGSYVNMSGANVPVQSGTFLKLLSLPTVSPSSNPYVNGTSVVQYGYQYFVFNSPVANPVFRINLYAHGYTEAQASNTFIRIYINGVVQPDPIVINGTVSRTAFTAFLTPVLRTFAIGDIIFIAVDVTGASSAVQVDNMDMKIESTNVKADSLYRVQYSSLLGVPSLATDNAGNIRTDIAGAPYNLEGLTPKSLYDRWAQSYIGSSFMPVVTGDMLFQTLNKNQFLQKTFAGLTIIENTNEPVFPAGFRRIYYPKNFDARTDVPITFDRLMSSVKNANIKATFLGNDIFFLPLEVTQAPSLNDSQTWKLRLSPTTDLSIFNNINAFTMPQLKTGTIRVAETSGVQFVPFKRALGPAYHTYDRSQFLFKEQIQKWFERSGYAQPVQIGDRICMQFFTNAIDPITFTVYKCDGTIYQLPQDLNTIASNAIKPPMILWQYEIPTDDWEEGCYYIVIGSNVVGDLLISECQEVRIAQEDTVLIEAANSFNTQGTMFDGNTPYIARMRVKGGYDNKFKYKYTGTFYTDQPQDLTPLNAIVYGVTDFLISGDGGVPDYVALKVLRYLLMDSTTLDGIGYTANEGADWQPVFTKGAPKKLQSIEIRPRRNEEGINVTADGIDTDGSLMATVTAAAFGPNISNQSGTTDTDLIELKVID